jgi:hypothetical protein
MDLLDPITMATGGNVATDGTVSALGKSTLGIHEQYVITGIAYFPDAIALSTGGNTTHEGVPSSFSVATGSIHYNIYIEGLPTAWRRGPSFQPVYLFNRAGVTFNFPPPRRRV